MKKLLIYFHTLKFLKMIQILGRIKFKLMRPKLQARKKFVNPTVAKNKEGVHFLTKSPHIDFLRGKISFLNQERDLEAHQKSFWVGDHSSKLWMYNLHYFEDLLRDDYLDFQKEHYQLIKDWSLQNFTHKDIPFEAYPLSLRIVNWIKWILLTKVHDENILVSLKSQAYLLSKKVEWHLLGNHLFENAKALFISGLFFNDSKLLKKGLRIFERELPEQFLKDGGHFEKSPMYHGILCEGMIDLINFSKRYNYSYPKKWDEIVFKGVNIYQAFSHPDKDISFFNDSCLEISKAPLLLKSYAENVLEKKIEGPNTNYYKDSGYFSFKNRNFFFIADIGSIGPRYLPGHAHCDSLSFELSIFKKRIFVNLGISTYEVGQLRNKQRSNISHNTSFINNTDSSEIWSAFRVGRREKIKVKEVNFDNDSFNIGAVRKDYSHKKVQHQRSFDFDGKSIRIKDFINSPKNSSVKIYFHLHPSISIKEEGENILLFDNQKPLAIIKGKDQFGLEKSFYYPAFNKKIETNSLVIEGEFKNQFESSLEMTLLDV